MGFLQWVRSGAAGMVAALLFVTSSGWAQTLSVNQQAASIHVRNGQQAFAAHRFDIAAREFEEAFELIHDAALLFNAGAAWEQVPDVSRAIESYQRFLEAMPNAPNRADVQARMAVLQRTQARQATTSTATSTAPAETASNPSPAPTTTSPPAASSAPAPSSAPDATASNAVAPPVTPPAPAPAERSHVLRWVGIGAAVLALGAGGAAVGLWLTAEADANQYSMPGACSTSCNAIADGIDTRVLMTNVLWPTASVLGAAAVVAIAVDLAGGSHERPRATAFAVPLQGGAAAMVGGSF